MQTTATTVYVAYEADYFVTEQVLTFIGEATEERVIAILAALHGCNPINVGIRKMDVVGQPRLADLV